MITDANGCRNHEDIEVPIDPSYYFWRWPVGCYEFCPQQLPRQIDGPWSVSFEQWTWYYYNNVVYYNNGINNGSGNGTPSSPLFIAEPNMGDGPGEYSWELKNEYCAQTTDIMDWDYDYKECCELDMSGLEIFCGASPYTYDFFFEVNLANCNTASFSVDVLDGQTYLTSATIPPPQLLNNGPNPVTGTFDLSFLNTIPQGVSLYITVLCDEHCHGTDYQFLPPCDWPPLSSAQSDNYGLPHQNSPTLSIMPNPARSSILVEYEFLVDSIATGNEKYRLSVCDALGRQAQVVHLESPTGKLYMDTRIWQPGIYFIEMRKDAAGVLTKRIVILK